MNTMAILLGATFAMLLAAVVLSFQSMNDGVKNAPPEELARLQKQYDELRMEVDSFKKSREQIIKNTETPSVSEIDKMKADLAAKELEIAVLAQEKIEAEQKAETYRDEAGFIGQRELEKSDNDLRRSRMIRNALLIAKVTEYVSNPELGGFVTIDIAMPELVQIGTILAIRRNDGILGNIKITDVTAAGGIGSPMPGFGPVIPEQGDELIIPPQI